MREGSINRTRTSYLPKVYPESPFSRSPAPTHARFIFLELHPRISSWYLTLVFLQVLPAADAANFMKAYAAFNGTNTEADVIKYAGVLLSRKDLLAFIDRPDR